MRQQFHWIKQYGGGSNVVCIKIERITSTAGVQVWQARCHGCWNSWYDPRLAGVLRKANAHVQACMVPRKGWALTAGSYDLHWLIGFK